MLHYGDVRSDEERRLVDSKRRKREGRYETSKTFGIVNPEAVGVKEAPGSGVGEARNCGRLA